MYIYVHTAHCIITYSLRVDHKFMGDRPSSLRKKEFCQNFPNSMFFVSHEVSFLHLWSHKTCTGPRFPRIPMNKVQAFPIFEVTKPAQAQDSQDSCAGPRFPRIPRFLGTIRQDPGKVPKNLGILGNLGPVHESCTLFIRILGNLGPVQVLWRSYVKFCCLFEKMRFPCVFWWWTSEFVQRVSIF